MNNFEEHLGVLKSKFTELPSLNICIEQFKKGASSTFGEVEPYLNKIKSLSREEVFDDFRNLRVNTVTVSISVVSITSIIFLMSIFGWGKGSTTKSETSKKKPKKKLTKSQKANKEIQAILDFVESEYVPQIDKYMQGFKTMKKEDVEYKYNYFEEMLLKELMKLDGIEVVGNDVLRENRKKVIKFIQDHQKRLDKFKKEEGF